MSERLNVYKRRIKKAQQGIKFVSYNVVEDPVIDYTDITNPINPFSEYYIPTTYNTERALVVPEREDSKSDTVEETPAVASKPIAEPVVNKPVASKVVVNTANSTWSSPYKDKVNGQLTLPMLIREQALLMIMQLECWYHKML